MVLLSLIIRWQILWYPKTAGFTDITNALMTPVETILSTRVFAAFLLNPTEAPMLLYDTLQSRSSMRIMLMSVLSNVGAFANEIQYIMAIIIS
jgi:hypothetical protein